MATIRRFTEQQLPYLLSTTVGALSWWHRIPIPQKYFADLIGSSMTMAVVFLGFMATSLSILISCSGTRLIRELKRSKVLNRLVNYLRESIAWSILWLIVSFLLYFQQPQWLLVAWGVLASLALLSYLRVVGLMGKLLLL